MVVFPISFWWAKVNGPGGGSPSPPATTFYIKNAAANGFIRNAANNGYIKNAGG